MNADATADLLRLSDLLGALWEFGDDHEGMGEWQDDPGLYSDFDVSALLPHLPPVCVPDESAAIAAPGETRDAQDSITESAPRMSQTPSPIPQTPSPVTVPKISTPTPTTFQVSPISERLWQRGLAVDARKDTHVATAAQQQLGCQVARLRKVLNSVVSRHSSLTSEVREGAVCSESQAARHENALRVLRGAEMGTCGGLGEARHRSTGAMYEGRLKCVGAVCNMSGSVVDVQFDPTGRKPFLAAGSTEGAGDDALRAGAAPTVGWTSMLYDYERGKMFPLEGHTGTVPEVAWTADGETLLTVGFDGNLCVWDLSTSPDEFVGDGTETWPSRRTLTIGGHNRKCHRCTLHRGDKPIVAVVTSDQDDTPESFAVFAINLNTARLTTLLKPEKYACNEVEFMGCPNHSTTLICGADDGYATAVDVTATSGSKAVVLGQYPHDDQVSAVSCSAVDPFFVSGDRSGTIKLWDLRCNTQPSAVFRNCRSDFNSVSLSPHENLVQGSTEHNSVWVFDLRRSDAPLHVLQHGLPRQVSPLDPKHLFQQGVYMSRWTRSGLLMSGGEDTTVRLWDPTRADPLLSCVRVHPSAVTCVACSPDETLFASGCDNRRVAVHSISHPLFSPPQGADPWAGNQAPICLPRS